MSELVGKIIEFRVTPELLSVLANFVEYEAQVEQATFEDTQTAEMLSRFLKRRRVAVRERVKTLLSIIETARVVPMDADINAAMFRLEQSAQADCVRVPEFQKIPVDKATESRAVMIRYPDYSAVFLGGSQE